MLTLEAYSGISTSRRHIRHLRRLGLQGVIRGKTVKTTVSDTATPCPLDFADPQDSRSAALDRSHSGRDIRPGDRTSLGVQYQRR
ncbi:MAG TPA: hypothetical protein DDZ76_00630 [Xanthomonadales bacterium]|nr:hypothetical protein [Xanthomonadales bacterium]